METHFENECIGKLEMMIHESLISTIVQHQRKGIAQKQLSEEQLRLIYQQNWFNLWVPKELGGMERAFVDGLKLLEELAYWDGGLGWTVTLCAGANMFVGFLDPVSARSIWTDSKVCFGGSGRIDGRAEKKDGGYEVTGAWSYATGAPHLTHFTLNAWLFQDGRPITDETNDDRFLSFLIPREQVKVHEDWNTFGLECTASHSFSLTRAFIPNEHSFQLMPEALTIASPLYKIPFTTFAELTLLVNYLGMFRRFVDLLEDNFLQKTRNLDSRTDQYQKHFELLNRYKKDIHAALEWVWTVSEQIWLEKSGISTEGTIQFQDAVSGKARDLVTMVRTRTAELMPAGGIKAAQRDEELNIVFRNIFTASQHALLNK